MRSGLPRTSQSEQVGRPTGGSLVNAPPGCGDDAIPGSRNAKRAAYMDVQREDTASWVCHIAGTNTDIQDATAATYTGGSTRELWIAVHGPGTHHNFNNFSPPTSWGGSRTLSITITPHRTGAYVFTIGVFKSRIDRSRGFPVVQSAAITAYTVTVAE